MELFRELNKPDINFCGDSMNGVIRKNDLDHLTSSDPVKVTRSLIIKIRSVVFLVILLTDRHR